MVEMKKVIRWIILGLTVGLMACEGNKNFVQSTTMYDQQFITQLGKDTLSIEALGMKENSLESLIAMRTPKPIYTSYRFDFDEQFLMDSLVVKRYLLDENGPTNEVLLTQSIFFKADSLIIYTDTGRRHNRAALRADKTVIPYFEMVHWPIVIAERRMRQMKVDQLQIGMLDGNRVLTFDFERTAEGRLKISHPHRGYMLATFNASGHLKSIDASHTTRKLRVSQEANLSPGDFIVHTIHHQDEIDQVGPLSGRGTVSEMIHGVQIDIDYGRPSRRGRTIFGEVVPWGKVWRTGANMATHFSTNAPVVFSDQLELEPGSYTIFTIPEENGGQFILNAQTGINGIAYDANHDLGRVPMEQEILPNQVELLTVTLTEKPQNSGEVIIAWGKRRFKVPFKVLP